MLFNLFKPKTTQQIGGVTVTEVDPDYLVTGQITVADVAAIKAAGFDTVMCNRPDGEEPGQPAADQIKRAVEKAGMKFFHVPMGRALAPNTLSDFKAVTEGGNGKIFAYCRTGNRCTILWKSTRS